MDGLVVSDDSSTIHGFLYLCVVDSVDSDPGDDEVASGTTGGLLFASCDSSGASVLTSTGLVVSCVGGCMLLAEALLLAASSSTCKN